MYGWGDNTFYKIGGDEKYITKNPKIILFSQINKKVAIYKIFSGYDHCYAISESGEIYGWGNARLNRLTDVFQDKVDKYPKTITIKWNSIKDEVEEKLELNEEGEFGLKPISMLDEIGVLKILNKNYQITSFKDYLVRINKTIIISFKFT